MRNPSRGTAAVSAIRSVAGILITTALLAVAGCASKPPTPAPQAPGRGAAVPSGIASYYADKYQGRKTANGETFDNGKLTAAHRTLPFGTRVRVTNLINGRSVTVRINDRGPFVRGRVIDLSQAAARKLDMTRAGVVSVRLQVLGSSRPAVARVD